MPHYFSPSTGGFYSDFINGPRQIAAEQTPAEKKAGKRPTMVDNPSCTLPADAVPVTDKRFEELMLAQAEGKAIVNAGGKPVAVDRTPDAGELLAARRRERDRRLAASDWTQVQDSPLDSLTRKLWADYRQALRDLDMTGSEWPDEPNSAAS